MNSSRAEKVPLGWPTPRVDSLTFVNNTIIKNAHKVRKKIFIFYVAVICTSTGGQNRYGVVCAVMINPPELSMANLET